MTQAEIARHYMYNDLHCRPTGSRRWALEHVFYAYKNPQEYVAHFKKLKGVRRAEMFKNNGYPRRKGKKK